MTKREAKAVEMSMKLHGYPVGSDPEVILLLKSTQLFLQSMQWMAEECASSLDFKEDDELLKPFYFVLDKETILNSALSEVSNSRRIVKIFKVIN